MQRVLALTPPKILGNPDMMLVEPAAVDDIALPRTLGDSVPVLRIFGAEFVSGDVIDNKRKPGIGAVHLLNVRVHPHTHRIPYALNAQSHIKPVIRLILRIDPPPPNATLHLMLSGGVIRNLGRRYVLNVPDYALVNVG